MVLLGDPPGDGEAEAVTWATTLAAAIPCGSPRAACSPRAMFFLPALGELDRGQQALAEMSADESAIEAKPGNRSALARAMLTFSDASEADDSVNRRLRSPIVGPRGNAIRLAS